MELFSIRIRRTFQLVSTVDDGFEYQWVRFFCFGKEREAWLQPGVKVDAKGEMNLSAHNGKINLSCKMEELTQYVADSSNYNQ